MSRNSIPRHTCTSQSSLIAPSNVRPQASVARLAIVYLNYQVVLGSDARGPAPGYDWPGCTGMKTGATRDEVDSVSSMFGVQIGVLDATHIT